MPALDLAGARILVTRPSPQADGLAAAITQASGVAVRFPVLDIAAPRELPVAAELLASAGRPGGPTLLVFISANAVQRALPLLPAPLPPGVRVAAVGASTARALAAAGIRVDISPHGPASSESLLAHPDLAQLPDHSVLIVRGQGGRELLGDTLAGRGARVAYAEVYRRVLASHPPGRFAALCDDPGLDLATATSNQVLQSLYALAGEDGRARLLKLPLLVISQRAIGLARQLGFHAGLYLAEGADDAAMLRAIRTWRSAD